MARSSSLTFLKIPASLHDSTVHSARFFFFPLLMTFSTRTFFDKNVKAEISENFKNVSRTFLRLRVI